MPWLRLESTDHGTYKIHVLWWHPGFWRKIYTACRDENVSVLESLHMTLIAVTVVFMSRLKK